MNGDQGRRAVGHRGFRLGRRQRGDLRIRPFPTIPTEIDLPSRMAVVAELRAWGQGVGQDAIDWYLRDKAVRRIGSRVLRVLAILFTLVGGLLPLASTALGTRTANWGYVAFAMAAGCVGFDHFFGLSSGWMRDMAAAQALQRRLTVFQLDDAATTLTTAQAGDETVLVEQLRNVRSFVDQVSTIIDAETTEWAVEFRAAMDVLHRQVDPPRQV